MKFGNWLKGLAVWQKVVAAVLAVCVLGGAVGGGIAIGVNLGKDSGNGQGGASVEESTGSSDGDSNSSSDSGTDMSTDGSSDGSESVGDSSGDTTPDESIPDDSTPDSSTGGDSASDSSSGGGKPDSSTGSMDSSSSSSGGSKPVVPDDTPDDEGGNKVPTEEVVGTAGITYKLSDDGNYAIMVDYTGTEKNVVVAAKYQGKPVTTIGEWAMEENEHVKTVKLHRGITSIKRCAFIGIHTLQEIIVDSGNPVYKSVDGVLYTKRGDTLVAYPAGKSGNSFAIPEGVETIAEGAFYDADRLGSVRIASTVKEICVGAFNDLSFLTSVMMENGVESIGDYAFAYCESLKTIEFKGALNEWYNISKGEGWYEDVPEDAAVRCSDETVLLGEGYGGASVGIVGTEGVEYEIPAGKDYAVVVGYTGTATDVQIASHYQGKPVTTIGESALEDNEYVRSVKLPDEVRTIEACAFSCCEALESFVMGNGVQTIGESAFEDCELLREITLSEHLSTIENWAFSGCSLRSIYLPSCVREIGIGAIWCASIEEIVVSEGNSMYKSMDGNLYSKDGRALLMYAPANTDTKFVMPNTVVEVGEAAFRSANNLKEVVCSSNLRVIQDRAFAACEYMEKMDIPSSVIEIGEGAFAYCWAWVSTIEIPVAVDVIRRDAFYYCNSLTKVKIGARVEKIEAQAFSNCVELAVIEFNGTMAEWEQIEKGEAWNAHAPATEVVCLDGTVAIR